MSPNANVSINTVNSEMDMSGARFVPVVDLTHDDVDTNSQLSESNRIESLAITVSRHIFLKVYLQFLDLKKLFHGSHNDHEKL